MEAFLVEVFLVLVFFGFALLSLEAWEFEVFCQSSDKSASVFRLEFIYSTMSMMEIVKAATTNKMSGNIMQTWGGDDT